MKFRDCAWVESPNFSSREGHAVDCVVLHHISLPPGEFGGGHVFSLFQNKLDPEFHPYFQTIADLKVSAHFFIDREGKVSQFVDTDEAAWHAGVSSWKGRGKVNLFSVGIELEGDEVTPYADAQYEALALLLKNLKEAHPALGPEAWTGHEDIAPGRKRDPGPLFDWKRLKERFSRL